MANNDSPLLGQGQEHIFRDILLDNTNQELNRHRYDYPSPNPDLSYEITDFILKRGDYSNTFIVINTEGLPDNATLYLVDENSNQLYSPVDTYGNWVTTRCSITVGENDIIPLPAQFTANLSSHTPFPSGTYNWKLKYPENDYYLEEEIPLEIEIRDFKVWDVLTPQIYPNGDVKVKLKTYGDTLYPTLIGDDYDLSYVLTSNATFDASTGIITYPNSDINDTTVGKHMQVINQVNKCILDYEVKNPIVFDYRSPFTDSGGNRHFAVGYAIPRDCTLTGPRDFTITINGVGYSYGNAGNSKGWIHYFDYDKFPPGTYQSTVTATLSDGIEYTCDGSFNFSTENCSVTLALNYNENSYTNIRSYQPVILQDISTINGAQDYSYVPQNGLLHVYGNNRNNSENTDIYIDLQSFDEEYILIQCFTENVYFITHDKGTDESIANFHQLSVFEYLQPYNIVIENNIAIINKNNTDENFSIDLTTQEFGFIFPTADILSIKIFKGEKTTSSLIATYLRNEIPIPNATVYIKELNEGNIIYTSQTDINGQIQFDWSIGRYQAIVQDNYTNEDLLYSNIVDTENPYLNDINLTNTGDLITTYGFNTPIDDITINNHGDLILTLDGEINNIINNVYIENGELYYRSE